MILDSPAFNSSVKSAEIKVFLDFLRFDFIHSPVLDDRLKLLPDFGLIPAILLLFLLLLLPSFIRINL